MPVQQAAPSNKGRGIQVLRREIGQGHDWISQKDRGGIGRQHREQTGHQYRLVQNPSILERILMQSSLDGLHPIISTVERYNTYNS